MFAPGGTFDDAHVRFNATLYEATGPSYRGSFASRPVSVSAVGTIALDFAPAGLAPGVALFSWHVGDISRTVQVERFGFGNAPARWGADATDLWFDPLESGWGLALTQHGNGLFGVWYTYDDSGQPLFIFLPDGLSTAAGRFSGGLYTTRGPWFGSDTWDASQVRTTPFGTVQVTLDATAAVQGFMPQRGGWSARAADGTSMDKFFTQIGFGHAAPGVAMPDCLVSGTCVARESSGVPGQCSYRRCVAAMMGTDYYGYSMTPCSCTGSATPVACTSNAPQVADGASCAAGQGCAGGSVCADLGNGMPSVCMRQMDFDAGYCSY